MDKEQKNYLKAILTILAFFTLFIVSLCLASCSTQSANAAVPEVELKNERVINAYSRLLHRIWLDKPSYVEDVLWESDEMLELDELLNGEWDKTFEFWSTQDSIEYNLNWLHVDELTHM
jgi:hypothetical protein